MITLLGILLLVITLFGIKSDPEFPWFVLTGAASIGCLIQGLAPLFELLK